MEQGRLVAILFLHDNTVLHWSAAKVDFVRDVAQRTRDAVERRRAEDHRRLFVNDLQHRVKTMLARIRAIAARTFKDAAMQEAQSAFANRVVALAHANDVLTKAGWTAARPVEDVVAGATIPHRAGPARFTLSGPAIGIAARAALATMLALRELYQRLEVRRTVDRGWPRRHRSGGQLGPEGRSCTSRHGRCLAS